MLPTSPGSARCERCGNALSAADAVCISCDAELSADSETSVPPGKHICPVCGMSFAKPTLTLEPADAKWYVPQSQGFQCPHCKVRLVDSREPRLPGYQLAAFVALAIAAQFLLPTRFVRMGLIGLVLVLLVMYLYRRAWGVPDSRRYVSDQA